LRPAGFAALALLAGAAMVAPASARADSDATTSSFAARQAAPSWFAKGEPRAAFNLIDLLVTSRVDGLDPGQFNLRALQRAVRRAAANPAATDAADAALTQAFVRYVTALRAVRPSKEWMIVDRETIPGSPDALAMLRKAADEGTLDAFVATMPWMHESYAGLRRAAIEAEQSGNSVAAARLRLNLDRARLLPGAATPRYILVNAAAQRLYLYENGKVVDWMRVVVGKATQPTPMMAALVRYTAVNPYWNLPEDLVAERIAPHVVKEGLPYLKAQGYVVLSDWTDAAQRVDPATIDWKAVLDGRTAIRIRQNPGPANAMGRMKFMFPNPAGVYLHDTPNKELLNEPARLASAGCVRLEDAPRLARWLYGRPLTVTKGMKPEQHIDLERPVPVYLAYLTAVPSGGQIVTYDDIYGRDRAGGDARLAAR
jgi:murein L,D-transpeptidase YcbB/YkuD